MLSRFFTHWRGSYQGIPKEIWFLSFISLINRCGSMVIAFIMLYLTQELQFGIKDAGYTMMLFGAGSLVGSYIGGWLTDKIGSFPVQFWSLVLNGIILILMLQVHTFWPMCFAVFVMALVGEVFRPANSVAIATNCTAETRTRSISLYRMAVNLGWAVAPAFGGLLVVLGWSWLFWVDGLTCIGAALMLYALMPPKRQQEKNETAGASAAVLEPGKSAYRDKKFLIFVVLTCLNVIVFMQFLWTIPVYWKETYGWSETKVGLMSAINGLLVFLIEMPLIFQLEGRRSTMYYIRIGLLLYAVSYACFLLPIGFTMAAILYLIAISLGEMFVMPFSSNYVFGRASGAFQGQYMALYGIAWALANVLAPLYGTQVIAAWGYNTLWTLMALQTLLVWVGFWYLEKGVGNTRVAFWRSRTSPSKS
jgi:predicted MFS family arabinose efflux permease